MGNNMIKKILGFFSNPNFSFLIAFMLFAGEPLFSEAMSGEVAAETSQWWLLPVSLFVFTLFLGLVSVAAGVGGGVLFVPIVAGFFPIHVDFVRGAGLLVALSGALSAGPLLLEKGLASMRLALPMALGASTSAIFGAQMGFLMPEHVVQISLGITILLIVLILLKSKKTDFPEVKASDKLSKIFQIYGAYYDESLKKEVTWEIHRTGTGFVLFLGIGFMDGLFGLGAGFANVPVLNLVLGVPLKIAVATSVFILSLTDTTAAWVYINSGSIVPAVAIPSVLGMMIGTRFGVKILSKSKPQAIKIMVIAFLSIAGFRALLKGLGI
jgi:hypothetical protein